MHEQNSEEAWRQLLAVITLVARHDPRPVVADSAAASLMQIVEAHAAQWQADIWTCMLKKGMAYLLDFPPSQAPPNHPVVCHCLLWPSSSFSWGPSIKTPLAFKSTSTWR